MVQYIYLALAVLAIIGIAIGATGIGADPQRAARRPRGRGGSLRGRGRYAARTPTRRRFERSPGPDLERVIDRADNKAGA